MKLVGGLIALLVTAVIVITWSGDGFDGVEPLCGAGHPVAGSEVSEGQAIALVAGEREVDCDLVSTEPHEAGTTTNWSVHIETGRGCSFSGEVDGETGKVSERLDSCE